LLTRDQYKEYQQYSPGQLAAQRDMESGGYQRPLSVLGMYPASVLDRMRLFRRDGKLSTVHAAELLQMNVEIINGQLLATLPQAQGDERREFDALPQPHLRQRRAESKVEEKDPQRVFREVGRRSLRIDRIHWRRGPRCRTNPWSSAPKRL